MKGYVDFQPKLLTSLKGYSREKFLGDITGGIIVSIVALPLAIAFGIASGLGPENGLITAIIGGFIVSFLGGSSVQVGGPTGSFIVIVFGIVQKYGVEGLMIATCMAGVIMLIMGLLKAGTVIKFIPYPIIIGYTAGVAVTIFTIQIKDLLGLTLHSESADFIGSWSGYIAAIDTFTLSSVLVSVATILIIIFAPRISRKLPGSLIAIVGVTAATYYLSKFAGVNDIETIGSFSGSLPAPTMIPICLDTFRELLPYAATLAILGSIESLLSAIVSDGVTGDTHNSNTELIAQGAANIVSPLFGGMPVTGAVARTMTNIGNGGTTPISGIVHSVALLLVMLFLGSLTQHIPMACLGGVLVIVSYNMSGWRTVRSMLKGSRSDTAVLITTFLLTVIFDLTIAIFVGMIMAMVLFMRRMAEATNVSVTTNRLDLSDEGEIHHDEVLDIPTGVEVYEIDGPFFFGVANKFSDVMKNMHSKASVRIIRMRKVPFMDQTGIHNLESLVRSSKSNSIQVILSGVNDNVRQALLNASFDKAIPKEYICPNINVALTKAREFISQKDN
ncbi:MAG: SulP family inorganic anion transporter [Rikenellaceae bacterium]